MKFINKPLSLKEIEGLRENYGEYLKLTIDLKNRWVIAGGELQADGEKLLLEKRSEQDNLWGGGIDLRNRQIDTTAILNLRPRLNNDNLEILDPERRKKFIEIVKEFFKELWS